MKKILSVLICVCMCAVMCVVPLAYDNNTEVSYTKLDYSKTLTVGQTATGTINNVTSPYIDTERWCGWATDGYTVTLEADKEYVLLFESSDIFDSEVNAAFLTGNTFAGYYDSTSQEDKFNGDLLAGGEGEYNTGVRVYFTPKVGGSYRVLLWNWFSAEGYNSEDEVTYSAVVLESKNEDLISENTVTISNSDDLVAFSELPLSERAYGVLEFNNDIDMTGIDFSIPYLYYFDVCGNGHSVTGLTSPLFLTTRATYFYDLTVSANQTQRISYWGSAALAAFVSDGLFVHCNASLTYTADVDMIIDSRSEGFEIECIGALAGYSEGTNFRECSGELTASISADSSEQDSSASNVGALVGSSSGSIEGCTGKIDFSGDNSSFYQIGALVGYSSGSTIHGCMAYGSIKIDAESSRVGGFAGFFSGTAIDCGADCDISVGSGSQKTGGFIGSFSSFNVTVVNCFSFGDVVSEGVIAGGFIGSVPHYSTDSDSNRIINCFSSGDVTAAWSVAGFIGYCETTGCSIANCYSEGKVTSEDNSSAAEFATFSKKSDSAISYCTAKSDPELAFAVNCTPQPIAEHDFTDAVKLAQMLEANNKFIADSGAGAEYEFAPWIANNGVNGKNGPLLACFELSVRYLKDDEFVSLGTLRVAPGQNVDMQDIADLADGSIELGVGEKFYLDASIENIDTCRTVTLGAYLIGDINRDGTVNVTDYVMCKRLVLGTYSTDYLGRSIADLNGDGKVNVTDYVMLKRAVLGSYTIK